MSGVGAKYLKRLLPVMFVAVAVLIGGIYWHERDKQLQNTQIMGRQLAKATNSSLQNWLTDQISLGQLLAQDYRIIEACAHPDDTQIVAEEVRRLAEQSRQSTLQISELIKKNTINIQHFFETLDNVLGDMAHGVTAVRTAGRNFVTIDDLVNNVAQQVAHISISLEEHTTNNKHISESVVRVRDISEDIAGQSQTVSAATEEQIASMHEIADASKALTVMAEELRNAVNRFII